MQANVYQTVRTILRSLTGLPQHSYSVIYCKFDIVSSDDLNRVVADTLPASTYSLKVEALYLHKIFLPSTRLYGVMTCRPQYIVVYRLWPLQEPHISGVNPVKRQYPSESLHATFSEIFLSPPDYSKLQYCGFVSNSLFTYHLATRCYIVWATGSFIHAKYKDISLSAFLAA